MHRGKIVESAPAGAIYENPQHEYTKKLLSAVPQLAA
jgi:oligopeptide/dipeptide ABC transporter ATP-binding protein